MAAISRAFARPRSPISARSRSDCRWRKRRCWWRCRNRRKPAGSIAIPTPRAPRATACSTAWSKRAACRRKMRCRPRRVPVPRLRKPMPILAPHSADQAIATVKDAPVITLTLDSSLQKVLEALARDRAVALGSEYFRRHHRGRQCQRRRAGAGRLAGLFRRPARRAGRYDPRGALAGIDAETVHLRSGVRGRLRSSGKPDRRSADPLRLLRAGEFRHDLSGHGAGAQGAAAVPERAGDRAARPRRRQPAVVAAEAGRRQSGAAERRGAGACDGSRRRRHHAAGSGAALFRAGAARHYAAAARDRRRERRRRAIRCG